MNNKTIMAVFLISLLSFSLFLNPVVAEDDDVVITIKGGFQMKLYIENNGDEMVFADFNVTAKGLRKDFKNTGDDIPIESNQTFLYKLGVPYLARISVSVDVEGHGSLTRKGINFMYFVIFFE